MGLGLEAKDLFHWVYRSEESERVQGSRSLRGLDIQDCMGCTGPGRKVHFMEIAKAQSQARGSK